MKLGPHVISLTDKARAWAQHSGCVKQLGGTALLSAAPEGAPRIYRLFLPDQNDALNHSMATALKIIASLNGYRHKNLYVETLNEISRENSSRYQTFLKIAVPALHAAGLKVAGPSFSTGAYNEEDWRAFRNLNLDAFSVHCYWGNQGFTPWHALRFAQFWEEGDPPILITECGRDKVEGGRGGWKLDGISAEEYTSELLAYNKELEKYPYVLGATVFTAGPTKDWQNFSTDDLDIGGLMTTEFTVGPGVLAKLKEHNDVPRSSERYVGEYLSVTFGNKGVYVYSKEANVVYFLPAQ